MNLKRRTVETMVSAQVGDSMMDDFYCEGYQDICNEPADTCANCEYHNSNTIRKKILDDAIACVCADRDIQYGSPEDSFGEIAKLWEVYLRKRCVSPGSDVGVTPSDVGIMMTLLKIARIMTGHTKADNYTDAAGYIACAAECELKDV